MITIVDYGMGNLRSVQKAFLLFYKDVLVSSNPGDIKASDKLVLPGVGAFKNAMEELKKRNLLDAIAGFIKEGKPFLGICLGLQLLFSESEEGGKVKGLNIFKGKVKRFKDSDMSTLSGAVQSAQGSALSGAVQSAQGSALSGAVQNTMDSRRKPANLKIPHMGWNRIKFKGLKVKSLKVLEGVEDGSFMYFVHSYYVEPEDKKIILCETDYGKSFTSGIHKDNIYAFQFHPEKSQAKGLKIVENFVKC